MPKSSVLYATCRLNVVVNDDYKKHAISSNHSDVRTCRQRPVFTVNISGMLLSLHINGLKQAQRFVEFFLVSVFFLRSCYSHLASACMRACVCVCVCVRQA